MDMTAQTIEYILGMAKSEEKEINGVKYTTKNFNPIEPNYADSFTVLTLTGIVDYMRANIDGNAADGLILVVADFNSVYLASKLDNLKRRNYYIKAKFDITGFTFNHFHTPDEFIVGLQSQFKDGEGTFRIRDLLEYVSTIKSSKVNKIVDNGVSQTTHLESGIAGSDLVEVPGPTEPILLKPFRTFREIDQPESLFQLRMDGRESIPTIPRIALYEADGQAWKIEAIQRIKNWLEKRIEKMAVIA